MSLVLEKWWSNHDPLAPRATHHGAQRRGSSPLTGLRIVHQTEKIFNRKPRCSSTIDRCPPHRRVSCRNHTQSCFQILYRVRKILRLFRITGESPSMRFVAHLSCTQFSTLPCVAHMHIRKTTDRTVHTLCFLVDQTKYFSKNQSRCTTRWQSIAAKAIHGCVLQKSSAALAEALSPGALPPRAAFEHSSKAVAGDIDLASRCASCAPQLEESLRFLTNHTPTEAERSRGDIVAKRPSMVPWRTSFDPSRK